MMEHPITFVPVHCLDALMSCIAILTGGRTRIGIKYGRGHNYAYFKDTKISPVGVLPSDPTRTIGHMWIIVVR
jgi:hypothetical protein